MLSNVSLFVLCHWGSQCIGFQVPTCLTWDEDVVGCKGKINQWISPGLWFQRSFIITETCGSAWGANQLQKRSNIFLKKVSFLLPSKKVFFSSAIQFRVRTLLRPSQFGGQACSEQLVDSRPCFPAKICNIVEVNCKNKFQCESGNDGFTNYCCIVQ